MADKVNETFDTEFSAEARSAFEEFGAYSNGRAIPDVRDGMKAGGRRTIWAIYKANAVPGKPTRKSALLCGATLAYHPHGDQGIYDGMVTMTHVPDDGVPERKLVPLIHGQGNFGTLDHGAAASRYTEARLNEEAMLMLGFSKEVLGEGERAEIAEDGVRMVKNYTGELEEPTVLPALWPQFVINGAEAIGTGVMTMAPGHHPVEALDLALVLVDTDNPRTSTILKTLPGPDLPCDADIYDIDGGIESYLTTGKGSFMMRAKYEIVTEESRGKKHSKMVITGLPFRVSPTNVIEGITGLIESGDLPPLAMRNLTDAKGMLLEIDLGTGNPEAIVQRLLYFGRKSHLQESFSVNSWAIVDHQVKRVSTVDALREWVSHRRTVIRRRTKYRLDEAELRLEVVIGMLKAVPIAHLIVEVVRQSANRAEAAVEMTKQWGFTDRQNQAILDMSVGQLSKLGVERYEAEKVELEARVKDCKAILADPKVLSARLKDEIRATKKLFAKTPRRCTLMDGDWKVERPKDNTVVVPSQKVYIARTSTYYLRRVSRRDITPIISVDHLTGYIETTNHDCVDVVTNKGNLTRIKADAVPDKAARADALVTVEVGERSVFAGSVPGGSDVALVTTSGLLKRWSGEDNAKLKPGRQYNILPVADGDEAKWAFHIDDKKRYMVITANGYVLAVNSDVIGSKGRAARGNPLVRLAAGDSIAWAGAVSDDDQVVVWTKVGGTFTFKASEIPSSNRNTKGQRVCHHAAPVVGAAVGAGKNLGIYAPHMDEAVMVPIKSLTSGTVVKRPSVVSNIVDDGAVVWVEQHSNGAKGDEEQEG